MYVQGTRTTLITVVRMSKKCADAAEMRKFRKAPTSEKCPQCPVELARQRRVMNG